MINILYYLWAKDEHFFIHERYRIQTAWVIKVIAYTATRPGSVVECDEYRGTNQAMTYNDIEVMLLRNKENPNSRPEINVTLTFNLMKARRNKPQSLYVLS
jgi:hypothetical protein